MRSELFGEPWDPGRSPLPSLRQLLHETISERPDSRFIEIDPWEWERCVTVSEQWDRACFLVERWAAGGVREGHSLVLCFETSLDLIAASWAAIELGCSLHPWHVQPGNPRTRDFAVRAPRLQSCLGGCFLTTTPEICGQFPQDVLDAFSGVVEVRSPSLSGDFPARNPPSTDSEGGEANFFLQTSGTTGDPRLAVLPFRSLVERQLNKWRLSQGNIRVALTTLPFDNVTVLGNLIPRVSDTVLLHPECFAGDPSSMLRAISRYRIESIVCSSSSAARILEALDTVDPALDLSSLKALRYGMEPIVPSVVRDLDRRLEERTGSPMETNFAYGMTETSLLAATPSGSLADMLPKDAETPHVSLGRCLPGRSLRIVNERGEVLPAGEIGAIEAKLEMGAIAGYLDERGEIRPLKSEGGWISTGDMGFIDGGEITVTGREKELLIVQGRNISLLELEEALRRIPGIRKDLLAAIAVASDRMVVFFSALDPDPGNLQKLGRTLLLETASTVGVQADGVVHLEREQFPVTETGKLRRRALAEGIREGDFRFLPVERSTGESGLENHGDPLLREIAEIWRSSLGLDFLPGPESNFYALGGDSIRGMGLLRRVERSLGRAVDATRFFARPTVAELRRSLLDEKPGCRSVRPTSLARERESGLPLSYAQQRLWFLEQLEGEEAAYNLASTHRLRGDLDEESLRLALEALVHRHEPLRTRFVVQGETPLQIVGPRRRFEIDTEDLSGLGAGTREDTIRCLCGEEACRPFDLSRDSMLRATLLRLAKDEYLLLLTVHHIAADGWSLGILWRELDQCYRAFRAGRSPDLPTLPLQFADHAVWQRERLDEEALAKLTGYWRSRLEGFQRLDLPTDFARPVRPSSRGSRCRFSIPADLAERLESLARSEEVTPHMLLLAAFQVLLGRFSEQDDVVVGVPTAGRDGGELDGIVGFFVNTLVLRGDLSGNPGFREFLGRVREASIDAFEHRDLPFEKLVEELRPPRELDRAPLVEVLFQFLDFGEPDKRLGDLEVSPGPAAGERVRFDLEWHVSRKRDSWEGVILYRTDLFDDRTMRRWGECYRRLLEGIADDPARPLWEYPLLTEADRRCLAEWNEDRDDSGGSGGAAGGVHRFFEERARRDPDASAAVRGDRSLSYGELDERANRLARRLVATGVAPDSPVGLLFDRSFDWLVGTLAVLKAGGACVPLDPDHPPARREFLLDEACASLVVTERKWLDRVPGEGRRVLACDEEIAEKGEDDLPALPDDRDREGLAYILFTSGSTGRPKGVAMPHAALVNLVAWHLGQERFSRPARTLQFASPSFDVSFQEMFTTWAGGGTLVLAPDEIRSDPSALWHHLVEQRVERAFLPFVALQPLALEAERGAPSCLRDLVSAGEPLRLTPAIRRLVARHHDCRLHNHYGPTETHVVTSFELGDDIDSWPEVAPIGRPIAHTRIHVLDRHGGLVPIGIPGELCIAGRNLARGYVADPERSRESFAEIPGIRLGPTTEAPERVYRSGDRARWNHDGLLEFLGRLDRQIKVRGFRVEPGEIEAILDRHPSVMQSAVAARDDPAGDRQLVAYCVPNPEETWDPPRIREELSAALPGFMLPSFFVPLEALPLTHTGKLDAARLPEPGGGETGRSSDFVAPRTRLEERLVAIWKSVLSRERIGVHDDFFELGGHSLLGIELIRRTEEEFGIRHPVRALFENPTVAEWADMQAPWRKEQTRETPDPVVVSLQAKGEGSPLFLLPGGMATENELMVFAALVRHFDTPVRTYGLRAPFERWERCERIDVPEMACLYVDEIRRVQEHGPYLICGECIAGSMAWEVARQLIRGGEKLSRLVLLDSTRPSRRGVRRFRETGFAELERDHGTELASNVFPYYLALKRYRPGRLAVDLTVVAAERTAKSLGADLGWGRFAGGDVRVELAPGDHDSYIREHGPETGKILGRIVEAARRNDSE